MSDCNRPIGILDSGIGGYSVARQVRQLLPGEDLLYFGDGAHVPYGNYSAEHIVQLARYMFRFLEARGVKALLVACNTISCLLDRCRDGVSCPVFSAVEAGARAAARMEAERVGVISTVFTHNSRCYPEKILALSPRKKVVLSCGCPDLARLVEHSLGSPDGMARVEENLRLELDGMVRRDKIECCVLGCTHYPLVRESIQRLYPGLPLIDPAEEMAAGLRDDLERRGLSAPAGRRGGLTIYTTGDVDEYALRARQVGLEPVDQVAFYPPLEV
ncbi:MAG: glutamate racemase [Lawsonibacter sp.]|nr:glutamate racemase [Lawsonibacter sp.]MCI9157335.1 glutamate racemase [Lawsonibacter sp.]